MENGQESFKDFDFNQIMPYISSEQSAEESILVSKDKIADSHYQMAKVYYDKSDLEAAETHFVNALKLFDGPSDSFTVLKIYGFLIRISSEKLENDRAKEYIEMASSMVSSLTKTLGGLNGEYFYNVGMVKNYSGDLIQAADNFKLACKRAQEDNEPELLSKCYLSLAINSYFRSDFNESIAYLDQLDHLLSIIKKDYLLGSMYQYYAKNYLAMGSFEKSLEFYQKSNITLQQKKCWNLYGYILYGKGQIYKLMGDFNKALTFFNLGLESIDKSEFKRLTNLFQAEIQEVNDSNVDIYLDRTNRKVKEKTLGTIDFKHRFVLLEILFLLAKNSGSYYDKEDLARSIWKDEYNPLIHDKLIYTSVSRLRKLIEPKQTPGDKRKYIVRGKDGYTFNPNVKIRFEFESRVTVEQSIGNVEISSPV